MPTADEILTEPTQSLRETSGSVLIAGIALSSFSALLLELALTRLFSVVLFYHFAFLAISVALLGLGAGGVFAHLRKQRLTQHDVRGIAVVCSAVSALTIPLALEVVLHTPISLHLTAGNFARLTVIYLCSAVPFFMTGLQFSVIFSRESTRIPRLYGADLTGGAVACLCIVPLLNWMGGPNAILFSAVVSAAAAIIWSPIRKTRRQTVILTSALVLLIGANWNGKIADIIWAKGVRQKNVEFARWNAISRVEVDRAPDGARIIVIDADANTFIMNADPKRWQEKEWTRQLMSAPPGIVNVLRPHGDYAVIGPGGGVDILRALAGGSSNVTGIEINPIIAKTIMQGRYADFSEHLYDRPDVHIRVGDGRSVIRNSRQIHDVVQMTLVDTWASTAAGAFALSENNLYTTEAFHEYFGHLQPDGIVAITRWEFKVPREALRVVSVATEALHQLGVKDVSGNFMVVAQDKLDEDGINVTVLAKKSAFTPDEEAAVKRHIAEHPPLQVLYMPSEHLPNAFTRLIESNDPVAFSSSYPYNVTPVTDNAPFFFFTMKSHQLLHLHTRKSMDWKVNLGVAVLLMLLLISVIAVLAFLVLPLLFQGGTRSVPSSLIYFIAVGLGYILVEVCLIQRFVLFLGHPTYALTVVVFLMLLSSGAGSVLSRRWLTDTRQIWLPLILVISVLGLYVGVLPRLLDAVVGIAFFAKLAFSAVLLVPLGFVMGMPFPTGLRALARSIERQATANSIEWAWALNAAASVLGSVLAIVIAIQFGFNVTLACGAGAYVLALLFNGQLHPRSAS